jgi:hypothetical protein
LVNAHGVHHIFAARKRRHRASTSVVSLLPTKSFDPLNLTNQQLSREKSAWWGKFNNQKNPSA